MRSGNEGVLSKHYAKAILFELMGTSNKNWDH
jgi:hypothetical protein